MRRLLGIALIGMLAWVSADAQTAVNISPAPIQRFVDNNGNALAGGKLFVYQAGSTTKATTYTDAGGGTAQTNPIILNSRGEPQNNSGTSLGIWLPPNLSYKFVLAPSTDTDPPTNPIWTIDNVPSGATAGAEIVVSNNTALKALSSTAASFFKRMSFATAGDAPPLTFRSTNAVCTVSSGNGDNGSQVKLADNNCAIAIFPESGIDAREFGLTSSASAATSTPIAQAALDAGYNLSVPATVAFPASFNSNTLYTYLGVIVKCGGVDNPIYRKIAGGALFVSVVAPGDHWFKYPGALIGSPKGPRLRDCFIDNGGLDGTGAIIQGEQWELSNVGSVNAGTGASQMSASSSGTTLTVYSNLIGASLTAGGSGYSALGGGASTITLAGGTAINAAVVTIDTVDGSGQITGWHISNPGAYSATAASLTQASTSTSGSGATFGSATWGLERGTITTGQMVLCSGCLVANNTYPTIAGLGTGTGGPGTYTLSTSLSATTRQMVTSSVWSFTDGAGAHTLPSAAISFLGSNEDGIFDGRYVGGYVGSNNFNSQGCLSTSNIGLYMDTTTTTGGEKFNENLVQNIDGPCNYIGILLANGANNTIEGFDGQFNSFVVLNGTGASNAFSNHYKNIYCEGGQPVLTWYCIMYGPGSSGSTSQDGLGSGGYVVQFTLFDATYTTFDLDTYATIRDRAHIDTFYPSTSYATYPAPRLTESYILNGNDGQNTEIAAIAYLGTPHISGGFSRGTNLAPAVVQAGDVLARHGGFMQYDGTRQLAHYGYGAFMDVRSAAGVTASNFNSYLVFAAVPGSSTTPVDYWKIDTNGRFTGLTNNAVPKWSSSTTGAGTQTLTNSPCVALTVAQWIPVEITGQTGTWYTPACQ